jgi:DNA-binding CsgD family transcriptional regulator
MLCLAEPTTDPHTPVWPVQSSASRPLYGSEGLSEDVIVQALDTLRMIRNRVAGHMNPERAEAWLDSQRLHDVAGVERFVARSWLETTRVLNSAHNLPPSAVADLVAALNRLRDLEAATIAHRRASAASLHHRSVNALFEVSCSSSTDELFQSIPRQACGLGFDRVLFSTVTADTWHPRSVYNRDQSTWATRYLTDESANYRVPAAAAHRHTVRVEAATMLEHRQREYGYMLWKRSRSKSFWMIPLVDRQRVVGMIHADCHLSERIPTQTEIEALQEFCQRVSPLVSREIVKENSSAELPLRTTRESISMAETLRLLDNSRTEAPNTLSLREIEVVTLMAQGLTNLQIGRRLTITEGTVKSHVKRILKKTGSANRAEAVATWLKTQAVAPA